MNKDPKEELFLTAIIICAIAGAAIGFGVTEYADYADDGEVFNGSVEAKNYFVNTLVGGTIGAGVGMVAPYVPSIMASSITVSIPTGLAYAGGGAATVAITVTGAQVLGGLIAIGLGIMFAKGFGPRMGNNQHEKQMWNEAMRRFNVKDKDLRRRLHDEVHKYPYQDNLKGLMDIIEKIFKKWGM